METGSTSDRSISGQVRALLSQGRTAEQLSEEDTSLMHVIGQNNFLSILHLLSLNLPLTKAITSFESSIAVNASFSENMSIEVPPGRYDGYRVVK